MLFCIGAFLSSSTNTIPKFLPCVCVYTQYINEDTICSSSISTILHQTLKDNQSIDNNNKGDVLILVFFLNVLMKIICHPYSINWSAVVVDEAHKIKNPNSQITQAMKDLKCEVRIYIMESVCYV